MERQATYNTNEERCYDKYECSLKEQVVCLKKWNNWDRLYFVCGLGYRLGTAILKKVKSGTRVTKQATHFEDLPLLRSQKNNKKNNKNNSTIQVKTAEMKITSWLTGLILELVIMTQRIRWSLSALISCKI